MQLTFHRLRSILLFVTCLCLLALPARATTIVQLSFDEVVQAAQLVFEGRVTAVEAKQTGPRAIHTIVSFEILELIKGDYAHSTIDLSFLGGRVGDTELRVSEMQVPQLGETGVYFVGNPAQDMIHPLVGWSQGHYLTRSATSGTARITTADGQPVADITDAETAAPQAAAILPEGAPARGVQIQSLQNNQTMSASAFKAKVRQIHQQHVELVRP